jgi:hypothetical protein
VLGDVALEPDEEGESLTVLQLDRDDSTHFVIGTAFIRPGEAECTRGRILMYTRKASKTQGDMFVCSAHTDVNGCVYSLTTLPRSRIAAAVNYMV